MDFHTQVTYYSGVFEKEVVDIFLAPSLQTLQQLQFTVDVAVDKFERSWYPRFSPSYYHKF